METTTLTACSGIEEADSQTMGVDLQEPVCELQPANVLVMGAVTKLLAHIKLIKLISGEWRLGCVQWRQKWTCLEVLELRRSKVQHSPIT